MYVKIENDEILEYPYTIRALKEDNPNTGFPKILSDELLEGYGVYRVVYNDPPEHDYNIERVEMQTEPSLIDGVWQISHDIIPLSEDELAEKVEEKAQGNYIMINSLLSQTDHWALQDTPDMTDEQIAYRAALRLLDQHSNWPYLEDTDWPVKP